MTVEGGSLFTCTTANGKKIKIFMVIGQHMNLTIHKGVPQTLTSCYFRLLKIQWNFYGNQAMCDFEKHAKTGNSQAYLLLHLGNTTVRRVVFCGPVNSSPLGPQLKLPIKVTKRMPLQCITYFLKILAI